jgi:lysophospholipase L1-like esterase
MTKPLQDGVLASGASFLPVPHVGWTARSVRLQLENNQQIGGTLAIVSLGSNDEALLDPSTEAADVAQIVSLLRLRGARRIVWVLGPNYAVAHPPAPATKASQQAFANLVAAQPGVEIIVPSNAVAATIGPDGIHLPPAGYAALAQQVLSTLR